MRKFSLFLSLFFFLCLPIVSQAATGTLDWRHPSRIRLLFHGDISIAENTKIFTSFLPAGNLLGELAPNLYLGLEYKVVKELGIAPILGWAFKPDEPILATQLFPEFGNFRGWVDIELLLPSQNGYIFGMMQYILLPWLRVGAETEAMGNWSDRNSWSTGIGPDIRFLFFKKIVRLDLAVQWRSLNGHWRPEFACRMHLFHETL